MTRTAKASSSTKSTDVIMRNISCEDDESVGCNNSRKDERNSFCGQRFVDDLLNEASKIRCDESINEFNEFELPKFYNPDKFRRAQIFFKENIFALYFNKLLGLVVTLSSPMVLNILQMTKMSGCTMLAYRRYLATLLHMNLWYEDDLSLKSKSMKSINLVKKMHNAASKKAIAEGFCPITQKDMVLTQFGFMGLAVARSEMVGIYNPSEYDLGCFIHFWRVIGSLMGIQDRFNLCRESVVETKLICDVLIRKVFRPALEEKDENFLEMTSHLVEGMWHTNPMLHHRVFTAYLYEILKTDNSGDKKTFDVTENMYFELTFFEKLYFKFVCFVISLLQYRVAKIYLNFQEFVSLWIVTFFPILAVLKFGYKNAIVRVTPSSLRKSNSN